jgi:flagellum-specific peptidoglycan hydrolase FlgJ
MMTNAQRDFLCNAKTEAVKANHPFPIMAACEAALESAWGNSMLARDGNNLFGTKQHTHPIFETLNLPTREFLSGNWTTVEAGWVHYPDIASCFADRLATLQRLATMTNAATGALEYPNYANALAATDPLTYIKEVSQTWSTDPGRAAKVTAIYQEYLSETGVS